MRVATGPGARNRLARLLQFAIVLCLAACVPPADAQNTRFPGDSPTRPRFEADGSIRTPGAPNNRQRSIVVVGAPYGGIGYGGWGYSRGYGGYSNSGYGGYSYSGYANGPYYGYSAGYGGYSGGYPYGGRYGVDPGFCPVCGLRYDLCCCRGPVILPPVQVNPADLYGPEAVRRFLGAPSPSAVTPASAAAEFNADLPRGPIAAPRQIPQQADPEEDLPQGKLDRAWRYIDQGDRFLQEGRARDAAGRYRRAVAAADRLADAHFRQGLSEAVLGLFDRSAQTLRRGLRLNPQWPGSEFDARRVLTEKAYRETVLSIEDRLIDRPNDAEALFVLAVLEHFGGAPKTAAQRFGQVSHLTGGEWHARLFIEAQQAVVEGPENQQPAKKRDQQPPAPAP